MNKNKISILCYGEALWDQLPAGHQPGGAPMNVAIHLKRLGNNVNFVSRVGEGKPGIDLIGFMKSSGLSVDFVQIDKKLPTSEVFVQLDENMNASYNIIKPVAWDNIEMTKSLNKLLNEVSCIVYGSLIARSERSYQTLLKIINSEAIKVMDVNLRPPNVNRSILDSLLLKADIIKVNEEELSVLSKGKNESEKLNCLSDNYQSKMVILTKGADGSIVFEHGKLFQHDGFKIDVEDTVGAGDAFLAGFLSKYLYDRNIPKALSFGNALGALVASRVGATPQYYWEDILKVES